MHHHERGVMEMTTRRKKNSKKSKDFGFVVNQTP
jgi:hypothetical protein